MPELVRVRLQSGQEWRCSPEAAALHGLQVIDDAAPAVAAPKRRNGPVARRQRASARPRASATSPETASSEAPTSADESPADVPQSTASAESPEE